MRELVDGGEVCRHHGPVEEKSKETEEVMDCKKRGAQNIIPK